ncbi:MAG: hypothetical protein CMJ58_21155 [Planctomycetaceae bacterium]|nr:hypothetical protein [Planctomycetaceae bacterium]
MEELPAIVRVVAGDLVGGPVEILGAERLESPAAAGQGELQRRDGGEHRARAAPALPARLHAKFRQGGAEVHGARQRLDVIRRCVRADRGGLVSRSARNRRLA